jgi:hypothetical protein
VQAGWPNGQSPHSPAAPCGSHITAGHCLPHHGCLCLRPIEPRALSLSFPYIGAECRFYLSRQGAPLQVFPHMRVSSIFHPSFHSEMPEGLPRNPNDRSSELGHRSATPRAEISVATTISAPSSEKLFHELYSSVNGRLTSSSPSSSRRTPPPPLLITEDLSPT